MKKIIFVLSILFLSSPLLAQLPDTDIWLLDIKTTKDSIILSNPINITNRAGYDNQPAFSPDGTYILYTSVRDDDQSDIYKYDLKTKTISQFTKTKTSEYSPTFMPDGKNISVVMVEPDSNQRLWKFPISGGDPTCIIQGVDSIGYHCWINKDSLALVMITEPPTLRVVDIHSQKNNLFATDVSRCLYSFSGHSFCYMTKVNNGKDTAWSLGSSKINYHNICISQEPMILPYESQDYCIHLFREGPIVFFSCKNKIIGMNYFDSTVFCESNMEKLMSHISRIAISSDGKKIAIVGEAKK